MPRTKQSVIESSGSEVELNKTIANLRKQLKQEKEKGIKLPICLSCGKTGEYSFYASLNPIYKVNNCKIPYCKECITKYFNDYTSKYNSDALAVYYVCRKFNIFFSTAAVESAKRYSQKTGWLLIASYLKEINSLNATIKYGTCFEESANFLDIEDLTQKLQEEFEEKSKQPSVYSDTNINDKITKLDKSNRDDCIKLLGYDPFADEEEKSRKFLYNTLIEYLNEETLHDPFKLSSCIEITKIFGQVDQINKAIATITGDPTALAGQPASLKNLVDSKRALYASALNLAKDNGVSLLNATNKSVGAGTLSGLMKKFGELDLKSAEINKFDADTCEGIKQVAKASINAIIDKLNLKEDDYVDMIKEQREKIVEQTDELKQLREDNRLLKIKLLEIGNEE